MDMITRGWSMESGTKNKNYIRPSKKQIKINLLLAFCL